MSEKLDGVRAMWDGKGKLISRNGKPFKAPLEFTSCLPRGVILDGELWMDRGMFSDTVSIIRTRDKWSSLIKYKVFDAITPKIRHLAYQDRIKWIENCNKFSSHVSIHESVCLENPILLADHLSSILSEGGEGLIIRDPSSHYSPGRKSPLLSPILKVKPYVDDEAEVVNVQLRGGRRGSLTVRDREGREFKIASGLRDIEREEPPRAGDMITFGYTSRYEISGLPRFPRYIRKRLDYGM